MGSRSHTSRRRKAPTTGTEIELLHELVRILCPGLHHLTPKQVEALLERPDLNHYLQLIINEPGGGR
jgi:hypothetical protein